MVLLLPIDGAVREAEVVRDRARNDARVPPVFRAHFETGHRAVDSRELLCGAKIDVHVRVVVFVHPRLEDTRHLVAVNARNVRTGRRVLLNTRYGNEIDRVARPHVEARRKQLPDHHTTVGSVLRIEGELPANRMLTNTRYLRIA